MGDGDFWELLTKNGISPDSATAIVQSHRGMSNADLWERLVQNGAKPDAATSMVTARGPQQGGIQDISPQLDQQMAAYQARQNQPGSRGGLLGMPDARTAAQRAVALSAGMLPGSTALGAYVASKIQGRPYSDVMRDVNAQMSDMPASERYALEFTGGIPLAMATGGATEAIPGMAAIKSVIGRAAARGAATAAPIAAAYRVAQPNPEPITSRLAGAATAGGIGAVTGGAIGSVAPMLAARRIAAGAPASDIAASDVAAATKAADDANFGLAREEANTNGGTSPAIQRALLDPNISPFVRDAATSPSMAGASDADILMRAHALMNERQGQIIGPMDAKHPGIGSTQEVQDLGIGKSGLRRATAIPSELRIPEQTQALPSPPPPDEQPAWDNVLAMQEPHAVNLEPPTSVTTPEQVTQFPPVAPSFGNALDQASQSARNADAAALVQRTARNIMQNAKPPVQAPKLQARGDFLTGRMFQSFDPGQQEAAQQALLSEIKNQPRFSRVPYTPILMPSRASRLAPSLMENMGDTRGRDLSDYLTNLGVAAGTSPFANP